MIRPGLRLAGAAVLGLITVQVGPAATWLPAFRPRRLAGAGGAGSVAVTFDDGPDPRGTPAVLDALDRLGIEATFCVLGAQVRRDPGLLREIADRGHEVALHGDSHRYLIGRTPRAVATDLAAGRDAIGSVLGQAPVWWRPPYGVLSGPALLAARRLELRPVIWTAWGRDWRAAATPESVVADLTRTSLAGGTLLLHDSDLMSVPGSWRTTLAALPALSDRIAAEGVTPRRLTDHLAARP